MGRPIWPKQFSPSKAKVFGERPGRAIWQGRAQVIESSSPFSNSYTSRVFVNKYGQKRYENSDRLSFPVDSNIMTPTLVRYPAKDFNDFGFFNGFPFLLNETCEHLNFGNNFVIDDKGAVTDLGKGFSDRSLTGIPVDDYSAVSVLGGGYDLNKNKGYFSPNLKGVHRRAAAVNHYWNLAAIETDFIIQTRRIPDGYVTGYSKNVDYDSDEGIQYVTEDYEVVESYTDKAYLPQLRQYIDPSGSFDQTDGVNNCTIDPETRLFQGSGENYSSMFFLGQDTGHYADFFIPFSIQPNNTGAYTICFDEDVATHLESQPEWGPAKAFNCNVSLDFNTKDRDHEGFAGSNVEYHCFPHRAYIVPAKDWEFTVLGSKVKGVYYTYAQSELLRYPGDQSITLNYRPWYQDIHFTYSNYAPDRLGGGPIEYNLLPTTHIPFDSAAGGPEDKTYCYKFSCNSRFSFLTPTISQDAGLSEFRQTYNGAGKYSIFGTDLEFYCGGPRPELVLEDSLISRFYDSKYDNLVYRQENKSVYHSSEIAKLYYNLRNTETADNKNLRKLKNQSNTLITKEVVSRTIKRKTRDYTFFSDSLANSATTKRIPLQASFLDFPDADSVVYAD